MLLLHLMAEANTEIFASANNGKSVDEDLSDDASIDLEMRILMGEMDDYDEDICEWEFESYGKNTGEVSFSLEGSEKMKTTTTQDLAATYRKPLADPLVTFGKTTLTQGTAKLYGLLDKNGNLKLPFESREDATKRQSDNSKKGSTV